VCAQNGHMTTNTPGILSLEECSGLGCECELIVANVNILTIYFPWAE